MEWHRSGTVIALRSGIALVAWLALACQLYILVSNTPGNGLTPLQATGRFFSYFTILTNLMVAIAMSFSLFKPGSAAGKFFLKPATLTAITLYILVVGIVYNVILRFLWQPRGLQKWVDEGLHVATPLLFLVFWAVYVPKGSLNWKQPFRWLIYPAGYLVYALAIGAYSGFYTYPFIDVTKLGYNGVLINAIVLTVFFFGAGLLFVLIDKKIRGRRV